MATLKTIFKLFDSYSSTISNISRGTDQATAKILNASRGTDDFNRKLQMTGVSANTATGGIGNLEAGLARLIGTFLSFAVFKKGIDITDTYTNTAARLSLINDGLQTQAELQDKIFAAAKRSRGSYNDMADAVAKIGLLAGDAFGSNDELIAFTELTQKAFKVGGADTATQQGAMRQLTQALASGRLQGDELTSIMEGAPLMYKAIAKYTGKSEGELKEMGSQGKISADIIKNAMFMAAKDIDTQFRTLPMTFGDIWNDFKTDASKAFGPVMDKINHAINSKKFTSLVNNTKAGLKLLAGSINKVIDVASRLGSFIYNNWSIIAPIIWGIVGAMAAYKLIILQTVVAKAAHTVASWLETAAIVALIAAQDGFNAALRACPLTWIVTGVIILISLFYVVIALINKITGHSYSATGIILGCINVVITAFKNLGLWVLDVILGTSEALNAMSKNIDVGFTNAWINIQAGWDDFVSHVLYGVRSVINGLNKIPGVSIDTGGISDKIDSFANKSADLYAKKKKYENIGAAFQKGYGTFDTFKSGWVTDAYNSGYKLGAGLGEKVKNLAPKPNKDEGIDYSKFGSSSNPLTVQGNGKGKSVDVDMSDEDLKYLRDIAERDYINKFSTATLAPNINVQFGDVHEEADANAVAGRIKTILQEEIATAAEGVY